MTAVFMLSLMAAGALVYANALSGPFVFDDINFITKNDPSVHMTQFSWENIKKAAIDGKPRHRYLPNISFAVNYYFGGCVFCGVAAVASKENAGMLPVFILLYEWFFFQDLKIPRSGGSWALGAAGLVAFGALVVYFLGDDPLKRILSSYTRREFTLPQRVMTEFRVVVYYVGLLVFPQPSRMILDHDYPLSASVTDPPTGPRSAPQPGNYTSWCGTGWRFLKTLKKSTRHNG